MISIQMFRIRFRSIIPLETCVWCSAPLYCALTNTFNKDTDEYKSTKPVYNVHLYYNQVYAARLQIITN